jgi:hypothetical protein
MMAEGFLESLEGHLSVSRHEDLDYFVERRELSISKDSIR